MTVNKSRKITDLDYIDNLVAAHDRINRFLTRPSLSMETLWIEREKYAKRSGWLIPDDTVIDTIHAKQIELKYDQWNGKDRKGVKRIGLIKRV